MASQADTDHKTGSGAHLRLAVTEVAQLAGLLDRVEASLAATGAPPKLINRCLLASEEIVVNALCHGREDPADDVALELSVGRPGIVSTVTHSGIAFDPSDPRSIPPIDLNHAGGDGLRLVHQMVDRIRYTRDAGRNTVTLVLHAEQVD